MPNLQWAAAMKIKLFERPKGRGDLALLACVVGMAAFGCVMVYSASYYAGEVGYGDRFYFAGKQIAGAVAGLAAMAAAAFFPYKRLAALKVPLAVLSLVMLALVFVPGVGVTNYGATRWIGFGAFTVQPSEIAKYAFVLFAAAHFSGHYAAARSIKGVAPVLGLGVAFCALIIAEPNMSITMCVALLMLAMVFLSGTNMKTFAFMLIPCIVAVPVLIALEPYRLQRLSAFIDPWASPRGEGYQLIQSLYALGNGGMFGVGLFNSTQKYRFLPFAESDFILSVMGEELGFIGIFLFFGSDIRSGLDAGNVGNIGAEEQTVRSLFFVQTGCQTAFNHLIGQPVVFGRRAVAPVNAFRFTKSCPFVNPGEQFFVVCQSLI